MTDKPYVTLAKSESTEPLPIESLDDFKKWVLTDGLNPSEALRKLMDKYNYPEPDSSLPIELLKRTYPNVDFGLRGFRFEVYDSAYPNSDPNQFSDEDFDNGIEELLSLPPEEC